MAKLKDDWWFAFGGSFQTEEDVVDFIFERIDTKGWEDSYVDAVGYGEPNEMFKVTAGDKKDQLYNFIMELIEKAKVPIGSQCAGCSANKNSKCTRIGTNGEIGVCWMEKSEGEY